MASRLRVGTGRGLVEHQHLRARVLRLPNTLYLGFEKQFEESETFLSPRIVSGVPTTMRDRQTGGLPISAMAILSRRRMPPERVFAGLLKESL